MEADIRDVTAKDIPDFDELVAVFPCQPFSVARKQKGFDDKRGNLFFEITKIIDEKRPKVVFLENVANLMEHDDGRTFLIIFNSLLRLLLPCVVVCLLLKTFLHKYVSKSPLDSTLTFLFVLTL